MTSGECDNFKRCESHGVGIYRRFLLSFVKVTWPCWQEGFGGHPHVSKLMGFVYGGEVHEIWSTVGRATGKGKP